MIECPRLLFPFAREIIATAVRNGGFPPLMLDPVDFVALYRQKMAQMQPPPPAAADLTSLDASELDPADNPARSLRRRAWRRIRGAPRARPRSAAATSGTAALAQRDGAVARLAAPLDRSARPSCACRAPISSR